LNKLIPGITEKMLSIQLRQLERDGIVERKVFAEVPPRVEYSLTDMGQNMLPMLEKIAEWGRAMAVRFGKTVEVPMPK
jgi:DNA-binding HxlR family transcriptional regulator